MKFVKSKLELEDFFITDTKYKFIESNENEINPNKFFSNYEIDIDFIPKKREDNLYFIYIKITINDIEKPLPGYVFFIEGVCIFSIDDVESNEDDKMSLIWSSGISITINNLRNYISNISSYFPFGKFNLPTVDLRNLIEQKNVALSNNKKEKKK